MKRLSISGLFDRTPRKSNDLTFDFFSSDFIQNPYPFYRELRERSPVHFVEDFGFWAVSRYTDVVDIIRKSNLFVHVPTDHPLLRPFINPNRTDHNRLRKALSRFLSADYISTLEDRIKYHTNLLIEKIISRRKCDLMADLAGPLPQLINTEILGIGLEHYTDLRHWSEALIVKCRTTSKERRQFENSKAAMSAFFQAHIEKCKKGAQKGFISDLVQGDLNMTTEEILSLTTVLVIAGHETTTNLIGNAWLTLLRYPNQLKLVRTNPNLIPAVIEETMRYEAPVQMVPRRVIEDTEICGVPVRAGSAINLLLGSANRDDSQFHDPDRFLPNRDSQHHIGFGEGPHSCLGASVARLQARIALEALLQLPGLHEAERLDRVGFQDYLFMRGLKRLHLSLGEA